MKLGRQVIFFLILSPLVFLSSCASPQPKNKNTADPYEQYNRKVFQFNMDLSKAILHPVVNVYNTALPTPVRSGVRNVYGNIMMVPTIGNDLLQANFRYMWRDLFRLTVNTTMGCFGLVDVASSIGFEPRTQSFGLTLAKWGIRKSPYVMVPFFGPSTVRGTFGFVPDYFMSPLSYVTPFSMYVLVRGGQLLQNASDVLPQEDIIMEMSLDPYIAVRSAYLQNREYLENKIINETPDNNLSNDPSGLDSADGSDGFSGDLSDTDMLDNSASN